jgi:hypothetical protein
MKISEIKSEEVRNEAVRLALKIGELFENEQEALNAKLIHGFVFFETPQGFFFWSYLNSGTTPNTPDLKLPEKNPSE